MPGPIPQGFVETSKGVPNPAAGGSDAMLVFLTVDQQVAVRAELGIDLDIVVNRVRLSPPSYPGFTYECDMTLADAATPPEAPTLLWYWPSRPPLIQMGLEYNNQVARASSPVYYVQMQMVLWRRRVYHEGNAFSVQVRWHPKTGEITTITYPSNMPLETADNHRATALKLRREVER